MHFAAGLTAAVAAFVFPSAGVLAWLRHTQSLTATPAAHNHGVQVTLQQSPCCMALDCDGSPNRDSIRGGDQDRTGSKAMLRQHCCWQHCAVWWPP